MLGLLALSAAVTSKTTAERAAINLRADGSMEQEGRWGDDADDWNPFSDKNSKGEGPTNCPVSGTLPVKQQCRCNRDESRNECQYGRWCREPGPTCQETDENGKSTTGTTTEGRNYSNIAGSMDKGDWSNAMDGKMECPDAHEFACPREGMEEKLGHTAVQGLTCANNKYGGCDVVAPMFTKANSGLGIDTSTGHWVLADDKEDDCVDGAWCRYKCAEGFVVAGIRVNVPYERGSDNFKKYAGRYSPDIYCAKLQEGTRPDMKTGEEVKVQKCLEDPGDNGWMTRHSDVNEMAADVAICGGTRSGSLIEAEHGDVMDIQTLQKRVARYASHVPTSQHGKKRGPKPGEPWPHKAAAKRERMKKKREARMAKLPMIDGNASMSDLHGQSSLLQMHYYTQKYDESGAPCYYYFEPCCPDIPDSVQCPAEGADKVGDTSALTAGLDQGKPQWEQEVEEDTKALNEPDEWDTVPGHMKAAVKEAEAGGMENLEASFEPSGAMGGEHFGAAVGIEVQGSKYRLMCRETFMCIHGACTTGGECKLGGACCACFEGWAGNTCEAEPTNWCDAFKKDGAICSGHGKCTSSQTGVAPATDGPSAEGFIEERASRTLAQDPDAPGDAKCTCDEGFSGQYCELNEDACMQGDMGVDCANGDCETAEEGFPYWECKCHEGYTNSLPSSPCTIKDVDCDGHWELGPCMADCTRTAHYAIHRPKVGNGAACPEEHGEKKTESCAELVQVEGTEHMMAQGSCAQCDEARTCNGQGECQAGIGCVCNGDYTGANCELKLDSCAKTKCNGHGTCIADGAACNCAFGWTGEDCSEDPCERCKEPNGICGDDTQGKCHCNPGYHSSSWQGDGTCDITPMTKNCEGVWSEWSSCASSCKATRTFEITQKAEQHGQPCLHVEGANEEKPCEGAACCRMEADECQNESEFDQDSCACVCQGPWSGRYCTMEVKEFKEVEHTAKQFNNIEHAIPQTAMSKEDVDLSYVPDEIEEITEEDAMRILDEQEKKPEEDDMTMIIGGSVAGVLLCGGGAWYAYKNRAPADPYAMYADPYADAGFQPY